jgi:hypothetical protein
MNASSADPSGQAALVEWVIVIESSESFRVKEPPLTLQSPRTWIVPSGFS